MILLQNGTVIDGSGQPARRDPAHARLEQWQLDPAAPAEFASRVRHARSSADSGSLHSLRAFVR